MQAWRRWFILPVLFTVLCGVLAYILLPERELILSAQAYTGDGQLLAVEYDLDESGKTPDGTPERKAVIIVKNTACRMIVAQASARTEDGVASASNESIVRVAQPAKDARLRIQISGGEFAGEPHLSDGEKLRHLRQAGELLVDLGEMAVLEEMAVEVLVRAR